MSDVTPELPASENKSASPASLGMWLSVGLLIVIPLVVLSPLVNETRIWDDDRAIFANPALNPPSRAALRQAWFTPNQSQYNPLTHTLWWAIAQVAYEQRLDGSRLNARVYHFANLLVHVLATLTVFFLLRRLIASDWGAWAGAMLFAIHPVQVETVAWIFGMRDLLCGLLSIVAIHQYVTAVAEPQQRRLHYALALAAFVGALLSKSAAVVVPGLLLVIDVMVLRRGSRVAVKWILPFVVLAVPCVLWMPLVQPAFAADTVSWIYRPLIAADALAFYLWKLVWPVDLVVDYGRKPSVALEQGWIWWTWIAPTAAALAVMALWRRTWVVPAAALVFVIALAPVLGIKRFDFQGFSTVADRYLYLPMIGIALAAAWALRRARLVTGVVALLILAALAWRTVDQTAHWGSARQVWEHTVSVNPQSWSAWHAMAAQEIWEKRFEEAELHARRAIEVGGDYYTVRATLATALERQRRFSDAREQLQWIIDNRSDLPDGFVRLADLELRRGHREAAVEVLEEAQARHPDDPAVQARWSQIAPAVDTAPLPP